MQESYTPIAFVEGTAVVNTIFMGDERPVLHIFARRADQADGEALAKNTVYASADAVRYKLVIGPGQWQVWAELGVIKSEPVTVELHEGETQTINFVYGKPYRG
jgi:hypothetical protein